MFDKRTKIFTIIAFILMIIYFTFFLDFEEVIKELAKVSLLFFVLIIVVQLSCYFIDSLAWKILLHTAGITPSTKDLYSVYLTSFGYGLLLPSLSAVETAVRVDLGKRVFEKGDKSQPVDSSALLSSIVLHKMVGGVVNIPVNLVIAYSLVVYFDLPTIWAFGFMLITSIILGGMILLVIAISLSPQRTLNILISIVNGLAKFIPAVARRSSTWNQNLETFVFSYHDNFKILARHWRRTVGASILVFFATILSWINLYLLICALSLDVDLLAMITINFIGATMNSLPIGIPGAEGIKEIIVSESLKKFIDSHESGAVALLYSFSRFYIPVVAAILIGLVLGARSPSVSDVEIIKNPRSEKETL